MTSAPRPMPSEQSDPALKAFLDYVAAVNRSALRGVSVIAVSMVELNAALHQSAARADLKRQLAAQARALNARFHDLNGRVQILIPRQTDWELAQAVYEVRVLVIKTVGRVASELGQDPSEFTQVLHTRRDGPALLRLAEGAVHGQRGLREPIGPPGPLTPAHVAEIKRRAEAVGSVAFVREFSRLQAMARIRPGVAPEPLGYEMFISLREMRDQLLPGVTLDADKKVFQELTRLLDRQVLRSLTESRLVQGRVAVNINVHNLHLLEFERLAQRLHERDGAELWVDLDVPDMLANLDLYRDAQTLFRRFKVQAMGDSVPPELVSVAEGYGLRLSGYKFVFPTDDPALNRLGKAIKDVHDAGKTTFLTRIEADQGIQSGQAAGITHFQGFYINDLLSGAVERPLQD